MHVRPAALTSRGQELLEASREEFGTALGKKFKCLSGCLPDDPNSPIAKKIAGEINENMPGVGRPMTRETARNLIIGGVTYTPGAEFAGFGRLEGRKITITRQGVLKARAGSKSDHLLLSQMQKNKGVGNFFDYTIKFIPNGYLDLYVSAPRTLVQEGVLSDKKFLEEFANTLFRNHGITSWEKRRIIIGGKIIELSPL